MKNLSGFSDSLASVIENPAKCEQCGATTRLGNGVCVSCLMREGLEADSEVSSEAFESVLAEVNVPDRQWRLGNYEILEEIGRGGMGVIYRARQRHSRRIVALKRLLSYHADSRETLVRFRREAEAVASLDHPNILPIYEVGESEEGLPFFSMKFATGGSLQQVGSALRAEPRQSVQLMAKVARAVEYAHGQGILHRDLKPGNVLLDGRGEPLVSDFGLAKWLDANSDLTRSLTTFGTPGYIAPEQSEGAAADLTPAADVYSLGALLFDLLTGRAPFLGTHALSVIRQAAESPAPKLRSLVRSLDRDLETICSRCLERDPKARYQSAGDLAADLQRWLDGRPIIARPVSIPTRVWRWSRRNPKLVVTGAACLLFGAAVLWLFRDRLGITPAEKSIAVLPFENLNNDEKNIVFTDLVREDISTQLNKVADLRVLTGSSVERYKAGAPRNLREIARAMGVRQVLEGSVHRANGRVEVSTRLIDANRGTQLWAQHYERDLEQSLALPGEVAQTIADQLKVKLSPTEKSAITQHPVNVGEKSRLIWQQSQQVGNTNATGDQWTEVKLKQERLLNEATDLDSNCDLAYRDLVNLEIDLQQDENEKRKEDADQTHSVLAKRALDNAVRLDPDSEETHRVQARYYYEIARDHEKARREYGLALRTNPNGYGLWLWAGRCDRRLGRWEDCAADFRKAYDINPQGAAYLFARTYIMDLRRYAEAEQALQRAAVTKSDAERWPVYNQLLGVCHLAQGDPRGAKEFFARVPANPDWFEDGWADKIRAALYLRDYDSAAHLVTSAQKAILDSDTVVDSARCLHSWWEAQIARAQHGAENAREAFAAAHKEAKLAWARTEGKPQQLSLLACMDAGAGRKDVAIQEAKHALEMRPIAKDSGDGPYLAANLALAYAWTGERDLAIEQLSALAKIPAGPSYGDLKLNPKWDDLRGDPRFEQMVASLAPKP
ncbi:MAG: eukaryotic-like serine/threonine-protein kinase [Verrucomicrobiota bacterium]|jgi:serine/threonine protein kinase/Tfp pilus assembly protein PilF